MKAPPFLISATILFWGWHNGLIIFAAGMLLIFEGSHLVKSKWDFSQSDFNRITDLCTIILLSIVVFVLTTNPRNIVMVVFKWLPLIIFPILAAQKYSLKGKIDITALLLIARKKKIQIQTLFIDLSFPFFIICIFSAGSANIRDNTFYICLLLLSAWALWPLRSKRVPSVIWIVLLITAGIMGYAGHSGLYKLQGILMNLATDYFSMDTNPYRRMTAIGDIGELKLSDRIVFRVKPEAKGSTPILLREASYNIYSSSVWYATNATFEEIRSEADKTSWKIDTIPNKSKTITIAENLRRGKGILKFPNGAFQIENLPVHKLKRNPLGAIKVEEGPGLITYCVGYNTNQTEDSPPNPSDLKIPQKEVPAISKIIAELNLPTPSPERILPALDIFFQNKFVYSLKLDGHRTDFTPLSNFLLESRSGHCEYFATATTLILRAYGIPARYASGYAADEFSKLEKMVIVRARHAHAWVLAYVNGQWINVDTTPSSWIDIETTQASPDVISDLWSFFMFKLSQLRWGNKEGIIRKYAWWLLLPLFIILARRLFVGEKIKRIKTDSKPKKISKYNQGRDSAFYLVEEKLNELGFDRYPWETMSAWLKRIEKASPMNMGYDALLPILRFHYRGRFDHRELNQEEKEKFKSEVESIIETF